MSRSGDFHDDNDNDNNNTQTDRQIDRLLYPVHVCGVIIVSSDSEPGSPPKPTVTELTSSNIKHELSFESKYV